MNNLHRILFVVLAILSAACSFQGNDKHSHEADEQDHSEELQVTNTMFKDGYELFVDYSIPVANEKVDFIIHITRLKDYKPVEEGSMTVSIIQGNKGVRNKVENPVQPGIYTTSLLPKSTGESSIQFDFQHDGVTTSFIVNKVNVYSNDEEAHSAFIPTDNDNQITFLKEQAWRTDFAIQQVESKNFKEVIHTSGKLLPANGDEKTIVASFTGIVHLNNNIVPGTGIKKGESLLELSGKGLASDNIQVHYNQIKTDYEQAKADYERAKQLVEEKIVSQKDFIAAKTDYEQAKVAYENIQYSEDGSINKVEATLNGFIKSVNVKDGEFVVAGTPLVVIAENRRLILQADVSQRHWHCLPEVSEANFSTPYNSEVLNTNQLNGKLISYSRNASNSAWSTPIFFEINNKSDLIPGTYIEVYLLSKTKSNTLAIPKSALVEEQGNYFVFIQVDGESYEKRQIKIGQTNGREFEVLNGIQAGEYIVTEGAYQVKLASVSAALPAHNHDH